MHPIDFLTISPQAGLGDGRESARANLPDFALFAPNANEFTALGYFKVPAVGRDHAYGVISRQYTTGAPNPITRFERITVDSLVVRTYPGPVISGVHNARTVGFTNASTAQRRVLQLWGLSDGIDVDDLRLEGEPIAGLVYPLAAIAGPGGPLVLAQTDANSDVRMVFARHTGGLYTGFSTGSFGRSPVDMVMSEDRDPRVWVFYTAEGQLRSGTLRCR